MELILALLCLIGILNILISCRVAAEVRQTSEKRNREMLLFLEREMRHAADETEIHHLMFVKDKVYEAITEGRL